MRLWANKQRNGEIAFRYCGGWRFDEYTRWPFIVGKFDWSTIRSGTRVVLDMPKRSRSGPRYHEREPGVFDAVYVGMDRHKRPRFASTIDRAARLGIDSSRFAVADGDAVAEFVKFVRRQRASLWITRMIVGIN